MTVTWFSHDNTDAWGYFALCYDAWHIGKGSEFPCAYIKGEGDPTEQMSKLAGEATSFVLEGDGGERWVDIYFVDADGSISNDENDIIRIGYKPIKKESNNAQED